MTEIHPLAFPGGKEQFYPQTHRDAVIGLDADWLYKQVKTLIKYSDIDDVPDVYTKDKVDKLLKQSNQLTSSDGSKWQPTIDNSGKVMWKKVSAGDS